jgi:hypothetical protein
MVVHTPTHIYPINPKEYQLIELIDKLDYIKISFCFLGDAFKRMKR